MIRVLSILLAACLALLSLSSHAASATYSMKIDATAPKGSAGGDASKNKTLPVATTFTPCTADKVDALSFNLSYSAGKSFADEDSPTKDVYLFFYDPHARGAAADDPLKPCSYNGMDAPCDPKIWALVRTAIDFGRIALVPLAEVSDIDPEEHIYLSAWDNLGGTITEQLLRSYLSTDGLRTGTWQLVGIVADSANTELRFTDPATWLAWDVETFVVGSPWPDKNGVCEK